ncbi:MAG: PepSY-associated TM helix domain-containing protein, partial [Pseudomonadota bacterium]|nr:PepSY-associated TM helix domain-containing protein [Pseudomonadota bacterium]
MALTVGFMFAFSGLTGSSLVFYQEIDEFLNPDVTTVAPSAEYALLTDIVIAAQAVMPNEAKLLPLYLPSHPQAAMKLRYSLAQEGRVALFDV